MARAPIRSNRSIGVPVGRPAASWLARDQIADHQLRERARAARLVTLRVPGQPRASLRWGSGHSRVAGRRAVALRRRAGGPIDRLQGTTPLRRGEEADRKRDNRNDAEGPAAEGSIRQRRCAFEQQEAVQQPGDQGSASAEGHRQPNPVLQVPTDRGAQGDRTTVSRQEPLPVPRPLRRTRVIATHARAPQRWWRAAAARSRAAGLGRAGAGVRPAARCAAGGASP